MRRCVNFNLLTFTLYQTTLFFLFHTENYGLNSDSLAYYAVQVKLEDNLNISSFINTIQETGENEEEADDASKMMNSELETEVSSEPSSRSPFLNQSFTDFSYIAWPKGMSCGGVLEDVSLQTLSQKKILYTCPFCGIQTKDCNRHIEQKHSGVKEFRCGECKTIFGDFEALWHHLVFSKQGTKELIKLEENGSRKSGEIRKYGQLVECDICGQECMGQANLKKHFACTHPDKKPFGCHVCGKRFLSKVGSQICNHLERVRKKHICRTCGITFCSEDELRLHNEQPHILPTPKIPCFICDEKFLHHKDLYSHIKSIHAGDILKCRICQRHFDEPLSLRKHLMKHNNSPTCEICGKRYMESRSLKLHMRIHQEQVSCHLCGRIFSCASTLKEHMNSHIGEKPYNCDLCHEKFCSSIAVESHKARWHSKNQRSNKCLICGKVFRGSFARNSHHLQAHSEEERTLHNVVVPMFTCNVCGKTVRIEYKLKHLEKHKSKAEKLFVCEICGEGYSSYLKLGLHLIKHKLEKGDEELTKKEQIYLEKHSHSRLASKSKETFASMCHICGKSFRSKSYFSMHQALHSKHFRFECEVCGKKFPWKSYLNTHKMMHLKNKPFACPECGRKFATQSSMQCHIKVQHHKQRRFKCNVCLKAFTTKDCLKVHKRRHTGEKPYTCNLCGRSFADRSTFHKHKACHAKRKLKDMTSVR